MPPAITIQNLGKRYCISHQPAAHAKYKTLRDSLAALGSAPFRRFKNASQKPTQEDFWALSDVSFTINPGEVVGLIGRNGAGKSTLLKILSRITKPTTGQVQLRGRIGSLLEVGTGFHPELSGRENIYLNGSILGMTRRDIERKFDQIVDFAEVEKFLDTPVKRYSSGMYVRLAFSVAAYLEPEILIVDEVLAVGDADFQRKCLGRMHHFSDGGRTVIFVSHNMSAVRAIATRCAFLHKGEIVAEGPTAQIIDRYLSRSWNAQSPGGKVDLAYYRRDKLKDSPVQIVGIQIVGGNGQFPPTLDSGQDVTVQLECCASRRIPGAVVSFWLTNAQGERVATFFSPDAKASFDIQKGCSTIKCTIRALPLGPGRHSLTIGINQGTHAVAFDVLTDYPAFNVIIPGIDTGEIAWSNRPWGSVHWANVEWSAKHG